MTTKTQTKLAIFIPAQETQGMPHGISVVDLAEGIYGDVLATMQFAVQGLIQPIDLAQEWEGYTLTSNEEAKLTYGMSYNPVATQIWQESFRGYAWGGDDYILGNAILSLGVDSEGFIRGMTQEEADNLLRRIEKSYTAY